MGPPQDTRSEPVKGERELPVEGERRPSWLVRGARERRKVAIDSGQRAVEIEGRSRTTARHVVGQRLKGCRGVQGQPPRLLGRRRQDVPVAGYRQKHEENGLGIAEERLDGSRAIGAGLELRAFDESLNVRDLLRDEPALRVHVARAATFRNPARAQPATATM